MKACQFQLMALPSLRIDPLLGQTRGAELIEVLDFAEQFPARTRQLGRIC